MEETEEILAGVALEETLASVDTKGGTSADELVCGLPMFFAGLPLLPGIAEITLRFLETGRSLSSLSSRLSIFFRF